jgi:hypothetical protein
MSVPSEERKKYTKSCPGWTITPQWVEDQLKKYRAEKAPVSPPETDEATSCTPEPQTPNTEHPVASESILQDEPDLQTHPIEVNTNLNIWEKLLSLLKELASVIQNWKR